MKPAGPPSVDLEKEVDCPRCGERVKEWTTTNCYSSDGSKYKTCGEDVCEDCIVYAHERHRSECVDCCREIDNRVHQAIRNYLNKMADKKRSLA